MKHILGGEVLWNWTLVDMANEGERNKKCTLIWLPCQSPREDIQEKVQSQNRLNYINTVWGDRHVKFICFWKFQMKMCSPK